MSDPGKQDCQTLADSRRNEYDHLEATYNGLACVRTDRALSRLAEMESNMAKRELDEREGTKNG